MLTGVATTATTIISIPADSTWVGTIAGHLSHTAAGTLSVTAATGLIPSNTVIMKLDTPAANLTTRMVIPDVVIMNTSAGALNVSISALTGTGWVMMTGVIL